MVARVVVRMAVIALLLAASTALAAEAAAAPEPEAPVEEAPAAPPAEGPAAPPEEAPTAPAETLPAAPPEAGAPAPTLVPPVPLAPLAVPYPAELPPLAEPVEIEVLLRVDASGEVAGATIVRSGGPALDAAVLAAVRAARFEPATLDGAPIEVELPFVQRFEPPPPPPPATETASSAEGPPLAAALAGHVVEKGTRRPPQGARVIATRDGWSASVELAADGAFELRVPAGPVEVEVVAPGYKRFVVHERLADGERLELRLLVERLAYEGFEATVIGKADRVEVARTTLRDREIHHVPGTFGDPFRVVGTLPGVGQVFSLLGYPIVRGTSPGNTGFLVDGVRVPQLFHFLGGPSVIHPELIERVDFYPGTFPAEYGGYTGGIVDGITRSVGRGEPRLDVDLDLLQSGGLYRDDLPFLDATGTIAGRIGYPGLLLSAFSPDTSASYWDYQGRLDGGGATDGWTVFAFGSFDQLATEQGGQTVVDTRFMFHRVEVSRRLGREDDDFDRYALSLGVDQSFTEDTALTQWQALPRTRWYRRLDERLQLRTGLEAGGRWFSGPTGDAGEALTSWTVSGGAFVDTPYKLTPRLLVTPGVRGDAYHNEATTQAAVDPRLLARYTLGETPEHTTWLKGGVGWYHQPPRFFVPVPGFEELALTQGLLASAQVSAGVEREWTAGYAVDVQTYFHYMDPILFDLVVNQEEPAPEPPAEPVPGEEPPPAEESSTFDLLAPRIGRAYGVELLLRKKAQGDLFGWISYTLSRSERRVDGAWAPFDFDRTHMLHLVAGLKLPRNWELGGRLQLQSGRPVNAAGDRATPFYRLDLRIDKRAVYEGFLLDFYIDVINVTLSAEALDDSPGGSVPYVLPTVGFRAVL